MKKTIKTNWKEYLDRYNLILFNNYLDLVKQAEAWDEIPVEAVEDEDGEPLEVFQWYHIGIDEYEAEAMKEETGGEVAPFYSELIGGYILPIHHFGTPWDGVGLEITREA